MPKIKTLRKHRVNTHPYKSDADLHQERNEMISHVESSNSHSKDETSAAATIGLSRGQKKRQEKHNRILRKQGKVALEGFKTASSVSKDNDNSTKSKEKAVQKANAMLSELEAALMETSEDTNIIKPAAKVSALSNKSKHEIAVRESARYDMIQVLMCLRMLHWLFVQNEVGAKPPQLPTGSTSCDESPSGTGGGSQRGCFSLIAK
jgi:hypothetical protein